jgi:replicative DNA helicase
MRLSSVETELRVIKTICDSKWQSHLLGRVSVDQFGYPEAKEIFQRISVLVKNGKDIPSIKEFREDLSLSKSARIAIKGKLKPLSGMKRLKRSLKILNKFFKVRLIYHGIKDVSDNFAKSDTGKAFNIDTAVDRLETLVRDAREGTTENPPVIFGSGKNKEANKVMKNILSNEAPNLIPTGFEGFDSKNYGLPKRGVTIIAANTGGGKSVMAVQLLKNMYIEANKNVCLVSFEMGKEEVVGRLMSNLSGIQYDRIVQKTMSNKQKKRIKKARRKFDTSRKKRRWVLDTPAGEASFTELMFKLKPSGYDVILIDYINLLKNDGAETQAASLAEITRQAKLWSIRLNCLIVILAQMSDDNRIKYSRGITENADNVWLWRYDDKAKETGVIDVQQHKARNQKMFNFPLIADFAHMSLHDKSDTHQGKSLKDITEEEDR